MNKKMLGLDWLQMTCVGKLEVPEDPKEYKKGSEILNPQIYQEIKNDIKPLVLERQSYGSTHIER